MKNGPFVKKTMVEPKYTANLRIFPSGVNPNPWAGFYICGQARPVKGMRLAPAEEDRVQHDCNTRILDSLCSLQFNIVCDHWLVSNSSGHAIYTFIVSTPGHDEVAIEKVECTLPHVLQITCYLSLLHMIRCV